ncbi:MAG: hypothetical protein ABIU97_07220 [Dehalococcoidia bacterium]
MAEGHVARSGLDRSQREERTRHLAISIGLFLLTFAIYWYLGPQETPYSHQVSQANNLIHGHLDFVPEHSKNLNTLERVMYDGEGFCFQPGDPEAEKVTGARFSEDCQIFMQHALGPALMVIPGVVVWGNGLNQTLVSVLIGALTAPIIFAIARQYSSKLLNQLTFTILMLFGTVFWWVASNGGVWFFAHTVSVFFMFGAIYFTVRRPIPLLAGLCFSASVFSRPTVLLAGLFFVIMFSSRWWKAEGRNLLDRIDWPTVYQFALGAAPLALIMLTLNYLRFDSPFESGYGYTEQLYQGSLQGVYNHGLFDLSYIQRHPPVFLEQMPIFQDSGPYILPSWFGMAIWVTTPVFLYAYFTNIKEHRAVCIPAAIALGVAALVILSRGLARLWDGSWETSDIPFGVHLLPFWSLAFVGMAAGVIVPRLKGADWDRLVVACWAAIIPTTLFVFTFAATGWAQFGYRYGLDITPFLWLLVIRTIGDQLKWHHIALILIGVAVNLMGVLWIYQFEPAHTNGWAWVMF